MELTELARDLVAEHAALDDVVAGLAPQDWQRLTASPGWAVADQIAHLSAFDATAALAIDDPPKFAAHVTDLLERFAANPEVGDYQMLGRFRTMTSPELLASWRENRASLIAAIANLLPTTRVPWYGPAMGAKSFVTARLMETWAHGQDITDATGIHRPATDRLQHIAQLGVSTRGWSYKVHRLAAPVQSVRVELISPTGQLWVSGPEGAHDLVSGSMEEFCLVVTQRRHVDDTAIASGPIGRDWLLRAQAFAGAPTLASRRNA